MPVLLLNEVYCFDILDTASTVYLVINVTEKLKTFLNPVSLSSLNGMSVQFCISYSPSVQREKGRKFFSGTHSEDAKCFSQLTSMRSLFRAVSALQLPASSPHFGAGHPHNNEDHWQDSLRPVCAQYV